MRLLLGMTHSVCCYDAQTGLPARLNTGKTWPPEPLLCSCEIGADHYQDGAVVRWATDAECVIVSDPPPQ